MKILGMGNALVDVLAKMDSDKLLDNLNLPKGSMQLIDDIKFREITEEINKLKTNIVSGGSASNTIVGLANLNIETGFIGKIGKDKFGEHYKNDLLKYNVKPHLTEVDIASGVATTFISKDGQRTFGTYLGAAAQLTAEELNISDFKGYDYFYIEGYLVQSHALIEKAITLAKEAGIEVVLDMASYNIVEENIDFLQRIIPQYVDIIFANQEEAQVYLGLNAEEAVSELAKYTKIAIVKAGAEGSWIQRGDQKIFIPAYKVECLDSTGAGDLYAAGFIYGLINNFTLEKSGRIGTLLAANVIQVIGPKIHENDWIQISEEIQKIA